MRAVQLSGDPEALVRGEPWDVPKVYWCAVPRELIRGELASLKLEESSHQDMWVDTDLSQYPDGVHDDSEITTEIDISRHFEAKRRALAAHRTWGGMGAGVGPRNAHPGPRMVHSREGLNRSWRRRLWLGR